MNRDQIKGRIQALKGKAKIAIGRVIGDKGLERKGKVQDTVGRAQSGYGDLKEDMQKTP